MYLVLYMLFLLSLGFFKSSNIFVIKIKFLSEYNRSRINAAFRKGRKRRITELSFNIEELIEASDSDLFNKVRNRIHRLSSMLPPSNLLIRPPDVVVGGLIFHQAFFFLFLLSFFRQLISELAQWNTTIFGHMVESKCNLKMHVQNLGYPTPFKPGAQKPPFWTTSQLNGKFNGL